MASNRHGSKRQLPSGFVSIDDILVERVAAGKLVSLIGLVKDHQMPIPTRGNDYKCTYTIYDDSVEDSQPGVVFTMFGEQDDMPQPSAGDVLVIISAKVQLYRGDVSLISNRSTSIHLYSASYIPRPPRSAKNALRSSYGPRKPSEKDHEYISWLWHYVNKDSVPDATTFQRRVSQSANMKDKFCKLENVVDSRFCDIIVNVVKPPHYELEKTTLWVSDYTENPYFHMFSWGGHDEMHEETKWVGPFGRRSMQITCFEPHASQVDSKVKLGQWLRLRNVRIKIANNGINLEGVLHGERDSDPSQIDFNRSQIDILKCDKEGSYDSRLKDAIQRKVHYEKRMKKDLKRLNADEDGDEDEEPRSNTRRRRKDRRSATIKKVEEHDKREEERLGLNDMIKCESPEQPITSVSSIVEPIFWKTSVNGETVTLTLPFTCAKYRTYARVVDFRPRNLENFAILHKFTELDLLSDYGSSIGSGSDDDDEHITLSQDPGPRTWEWRFALQLEEVNPKQKGEKTRFWAIVDDNEAQQLTGMDACDLREDPDSLHALREQLFKLWGNLEEAKTHDLQRQIADQRRVAAKQPPPSSPTNDSSGQQGINGKENRHNIVTEVSNKPFACCIRQYGVRVSESEPLRANAGEGFRWVRVFGLYGTKICA